ncbi:MAG: alpha/beta fold hydrolase [Rhodospirillales bacterium]|nr:alpha/beta fold hydrolase [Rhodospirillales bacterium]
MSAELSRHFIDVGARRVHYTRAGSGPALVLLHESPCSAKSLETVQRVFSERFTVIAPDTPGFGLSDPLPLKQPEIADFADALAETLAAIGVGKAAVYGRHTGASIAVEYARRHPDRCAMAVADGYPVYSGPQQESRLTDYLLPLEPRWDGGHLLWLWFRYRDQHTFWPWHNQAGSNRAGCDVPDLDFLQRGVMEFLEAGDGYRIAYAAAFRHGGKALALLPELRVPTCFVARPSDSLFRALSVLPQTEWVETLSRDEVTAARETMELLLRHPAPVPPPAPPTNPAAARSTLRMVGPLLLRSAGEDRGGVPLLLLHDLPGSSALLDPLVVALGQHRPTLAFDLLGQGESEAPANGRIDVAAWAHSLIAALDRLGIAQVHVYGHGGGGVVATELALAAPDRVASLLLGAPPALPAEEREAFAAGYAPSADPVWEGAHLLRVWHHLRDQELWWPWYERTVASARPGTLDIDPATLTLRARECLRHPTLYQPVWQAVLAYPLREKLDLLRGRAVVLAAERDLFARFAADAAAAVGSDVVPVEPGWQARATAILQRTAEV